MTATLATTIARLLKQFLSGQQTDPRGLRQLAATLDALPIYVDLERCVALRANGAVLCFEWSTGRAAPLEDQGLRTLALVSGAEQYPALSPLLPARPHDASGCLACGGSGRQQNPAGLRVRCRLCFGLGWRPPEAGGAPRVAVARR